MSTRLAQSLFLSLFILFISACGGSDDATDTTPPSLTVSTSAVSGYSGDKIAFTITASDDSDDTVSTTINCDIGNYENNELTLPDVTETVTATCTVTATDTSGNTTSETVVITIEPKFIELTNIVPSQEIRAGSILTLTSDTFDLSNSLIQVDFDSESSEVEVDSEGLFNYFLPSLDEGDYRIEVPYGEQILYFDFGVLAPLYDIADPLNYVLDELTLFNTNFENYLSENSGSLTADENDFYSEAISEFQLLSQEEIDAISLEDWAYLAAFISSNNILIDDTGSIKNILKAECSPAELVTLMSSAAYLTTAYAVLKLDKRFTGTQILKNPRFKVILGAASLFALKKILNALRDDKIPSCLDTLLSKIDEIQSGNKTTSKAYLKNTTSFSHNEIANRRVFVIRGLREDILEQVRGKLALLSVYVTLTEELPEFLWKQVEEVIQISVPSEIPYPTNNLQISDVSSDGSDSNPNVEVIALPIDEYDISIQATITDFSTQADESFELYFRDTNDDFNFNVPASVSIGPPITEDVAYNASSGMPLNEALLVQYGVTYEIVTQPTNGNVTIEDTSSPFFTYTSNDGYEGSDSFVYKSVNAAGDSNSATVSITVVNSPQCETEVLTNTQWRIFCDSENVPANATFGYNDNLNFNRGLDIAIMQHLAAETIGDDDFSFSTQWDLNVTNFTEDTVDILDVDLKEVKKNKRLIGGTSRAVESYNKFSDGYGYSIINYIDNNPADRDASSWFLDTVNNSCRLTESSFRNDVKISEVVTFIPVEDCKTETDGISLSRILYTDSLIYRCLTEENSMSNCSLAPLQQ